VTARPVRIQVLGTVGLVLSAWLAIVPVVAANDCVGVAEAAGCFLAAGWAAPILAVGALLSMAVAAYDRRNFVDVSGIPTDPWPSDDDPSINRKNFESQSSAYDPAGTEMGGGI
jgi:hypothetical protein